MSLIEQALQRENARLLNTVSVAGRCCGRYRWLSPRLIGADFERNAREGVVLLFEIPRSASISFDYTTTVDNAIKVAK